MENKNSNSSPITEQVVICFNEETMNMTDIYVKIDHGLNRHATAHIQGMLTKETQDIYVKLAEQTTQISIQLIKSNDIQITFYGLLTNIQTYAEDVGHKSLYFISMQVVSYTQLMDITSQFRVFQDVTMTYKKLIQDVTEPYQAQFQMEAGEFDPLKQFTLQYEETDWAFLMRMASRFYTALLPDISSPFPRFKFGLTQFKHRGSLKQYNYTVNKNIMGYREINANTWIDSTEEIDVTTYQVYFENEGKALRMGDTVLYYGKYLYVNEVIYEIRDHNLYTQVSLTRYDALKRAKFLNHRIQGTSIIGQVVKRTNNQLKLFFPKFETLLLPVEKMNDFEYATVYSAFYCMPEVSDFANLYFPTNEEMDAFVNNSIKQSPRGGYDRRNKMPMLYNAQNPPPFALSEAELADDFVKDVNPFDEISDDPNTKMLITKDGNRIVIRPNSIQIVFQDEKTYLVLKNGKGIKLHTPNDIVFQAEMDIIVNAKNNILITAKDELSLAIGEIKDDALPIPYIDLKGNIIQMEAANDIKMN